MSTSSQSTVEAGSVKPGPARFLWLDLEMTGLDEKVDRIVEVAVRITDLHMNTIAEYHSIVACEPKALENMSDFVRNMHTKNGLIDKILHGKPVGECDQALCQLIDAHFTDDKPPTLAGNTVHVDRRFLRTEMPLMEKKLHYRILDVSALKIVWGDILDCWYQKKNAHRAMDDVDESIEELKFYMKFIDLNKSI